MAISGLVGQIYKTMNRRNKKREHAIWILSKLRINSFKALEKGTFKDFEEGTQQQLKFVKEYDWFSIDELYELSHGEYDYFKLYPAITILKSNNHIEVIEDKLLATKSKIRCTIEGELAYSDSFYQDDMAKYNHDKIYSWAR